MDLWKLAALGIVVAFAGLFVELVLRVRLTFFFVPIWGLGLLASGMAGMRALGVRWEYTPLGATAVCMAVLALGAGVRRLTASADERRRLRGLVAEGDRVAAAAPALARAQEHAARGDRRAMWGELRDALVVPADPRLPSAACAHDLAVLGVLRVELERERPGKVDVRCACGQVGRVPALAAGCKVACTACGERLRVPRPAEDDLLAALDELAARLARDEMVTPGVERLRAYAAERASA